MVRFFDEKLNNDKCVILKEKRETGFRIMFKQKNFVD